MNEMDLTEFPDEEIVPPESMSTNQLEPSEQSPVEFSNLKYIEVKNHQNQFNNTATVLDMLILYDEDARANENTDPNDPNSSVGIETLIMSAVANTNLALDNSLSQTHVSSFHVAKVTGLTINNNNAQNNLFTFRTNSNVNNLRNQVGADVVTAIIGISQFNWGACGIAFVQTHSECGYPGLIPSCGDGNDFEDYAFNLVTNACAIDDDTFTHELGHLMGANHSRSDFQFNFPWLQDVVQNGYPEAFGYQQSTFYNIMTIQSTSTRRLYFSNPSVSVSGIPTGIAGTRHNQLTIDSLSPTMATFRQRPDIIFINGFE